jgi:acyl carrier protein
MAELTQAAAIECVFRILRDEILCAGSEFAPGSDLIEAGLDSLALTQLLLSIEEQTGVWVDESLLTPENLKTAETLAALVVDQLATP